MLALVGSSPACLPAPLDPIVTTTDDDTGEPATGADSETPTGPGEPTMATTGVETTGTGGPESSTGSDPTSGDTSSSGGAEADCEVVQFADAALEAEVREALMQPDGPILGATLAQLTDLWTYKAGIVSLQGIECAVGLVALELYGSEVVDVGPLAALVKLEELGLGLNDVVDLAPLAGLPALRVLYIGQTDVVDLAPLAGLTTLEELYVLYTDVADLTPLAGLTGLRKLHIDRLPVTDLSPLGGTALEWLSMNEVAEADLTPLAGLPIRELYAESCGITDIGVLATFAAPHEINLRHNAIAELDSLKGAAWDLPADSCADVILEGNPLSTDALGVMKALCMATMVNFVPGDGCIGHTCFNP